MRSGMLCGMIAAATAVCLSCALAGEARQGIDVNETPPLDLAWPFFDWAGTAEDFVVTNHHRRYYYEHEFHFWLKRDTGERVRMVSRASTSFTDDWRFGPTYLPLNVDWSKHPRIRVIGVKLVDRHKLNFHDMDMPKDTCTPLLFYVWRDGKWVEWMINNWFHDWHKYIDPTTTEEHPGLDNVDLAQYYIDKPHPYDVFGHMNAISPALYDGNVTKIQAGEHKGKIYHGFVISDATAPKGYRIVLRHMWLNWSADLRERPGFGNPGTLKPHFVLPQLAEWNYCAAPLPLTLMLDTEDGQREYVLSDTVVVVATIRNHSEAPVKIAVPKGDLWSAFKLTSRRKDVSTWPEASGQVKPELKTLAPGATFVARLSWPPVGVKIGDKKLMGKVPLTAHYSAELFCDPGRLGVFDKEIFSTRIRLNIRAATGK